VCTAPLDWILEFRGVQTLALAHVLCLCYECVHCTTQPEFRVQSCSDNIGLSSCTAPNYYSVSKYFRLWSLEVLEVNLETRVESVSLIDVSVKVKSKARVSWKFGSWEFGSSE